MTLCYYLISTQKGKENKISEYKKERTLKVQNIPRDEIKTKRDSMLVPKKWVSVYLMVREAKRKKEKSREELEKAKVTLKA